MSLGIEEELRRRQKRRTRAIAELVIGFVLIAAGVVVTLLTYKNAAQKHGGGVYVIAYGPVISGFAFLVRGAFRMVGLEDGVVTQRGEAGKRNDLNIGVGFRSYVAWRYLMARHHRISRIVMFVMILMLFVSVCAFIANYTLFTKADPLGLGPDRLKDFARVDGAIMIGGFVLAGLALMIGGLRYIYSFFTTVPLVGVWIGTAALVIVLSVMSGFETDLRSKILGSNAHIQITREDGEFVEWREVKAKIDKTEGVVASTPYAVSEVVIAASGGGNNVIIKGIDPETVGKVTDLVEDLEDADGMKNLQPLVDDRQDLTVPQAPKPSGTTIDPAPPDMPQGADPIDYSQPAAGGPVTDPYLVDPPPPVDPAPDDLLTLDEDPIDYSGSGDVHRGSADIKIVDLPVDTPSLNRRTQALPGILVGRELVRQTHLYVGEEVRVVSPLSDPANPDATGTPIPFNRDYRVAGRFFTGMYEYDLKYVYVTLDSLQDFLDLGDTVDGIEIRLTSPDETDAYVDRFSEMLGPHYRVQDWKELNRSLFSALKLEKIAMFLVLGIVILVASFSIVGNLIMVVVEKQREIALIKTLGASDASVMQVFAIQGLLIGMIGTVLGVTTGLVACWALKEFGFPLNPDVYYIDRLPVHVDSTSVLLTAAAGVLISMAATFYPALLAARVRPAAGMRH